MKKVLSITLVLVLLVSVLPVTAFAASGTSRNDAIPVTFEEVYTHTRDKGTVLLSHTFLDK